MAPPRPGPPCPPAAAPAPYEVPACAQESRPDDDVDRDGVPQLHDKCPCDPETPNRYQDDDGCPDHIPLPLIHHGSGMTRAVAVSRNSARITPTMAPALEEMLQRINDMPLVRITCLGHAHATESAPGQLSLARAAAVARAFTGRGVHEQRLWICGDISMDLRPALESSREVYCFLGLHLPSGCSPLAPARTAPPSSLRSPDFFRKALGLKPTSSETSRTKRPARRAPAARSLTSQGAY